MLTLESIRSSDIKIEAGPGTQEVCFKLLQHSLGQRAS